VTGVHVFVRLGAESYALPVGHVLEVARHGALSPVPGAGAHVLGVRNLGGEIVPVFALGALLGATRHGSPERVCLARQGTVLAGLAVDEVTDVDELPDAGEEGETELLSRRTLVDGRLVGVVDMEALFAELGRRGGI
jgi:purine-binding chemotaxis protein CheW